MNIRVEDQLQLRKKNLFERIMKRRHSENKELSLYIDIKFLSIPNSIIEEYEKTNKNEKIDYLSKIMSESNKESCSSLVKAMWDQSSFFKYKSSTRTTNDVFKWSVYQLFQITEEFENMKYNDNDEEINIEISNELLLSLISEAFESNDLKVKYTTLEVLLNYSQVSQTLTNFFIIDIQFIHLLFKLTYLKNPNIIFIISLLFNNIFNDFPHKITHVLNAIPIHMRVAELLRSEEINSSSVKCELLSLINIITKNYPKEELNDSFESFIFIIHQIFIQNEISNESLLEMCLSVLIELSFDDNLALLIISTGIGLQLLNYISQKSPQNDYVYQITLIFGNLLYSEQIADYLLNNDILKIFQKLLNTYINSCNKHESEILIKIVFALNNISSGTQNQKSQLFASNIPYTLKQMCKQQTNIRLTKEVVLFYKNSLSNSDTDFFVNLLQLQIIQFLSETMLRFGDNDLTMQCLNCIQDIIIKTNHSYLSLEIVLNDLIKYGGNKKIEELVMNKNQDISLIASNIFDFFNETKNS